METHILRFEHPEYLYWLLVIPVLIAIYVSIRIINKRQFKRFANDKFMEFLIPLASNGRSNIKFILFTMVVILGILASANLQTGSKMEESKREGIDLMFCIDISNSMNAEDIAPSRLERSKQAINNIINKLSGDRIGIIVFAGNAYVQLPITTDYAAAKLFLSTINTSLIPSQGTEIGTAINLAIKSFGNSEYNKAIIVISDGEDHENGDAIKAAQEAAKLGIKLYTIGMGLEEGAPIPLYNQYGKRSLCRSFRLLGNRNCIGIDADLGRYAYFILRYKNLDNRCLLQRDTQQSGKTKSRGLRCGRNGMCINNGSWTIPKKEGLSVFVCCGLLGRFRLG